MNKICQEAMKKGTVLKIQNFNTPMGAYRISHIRHPNGDICMFKSRDGELLECVNLSKMKGLDEK
jgi:hypothetical protein